MLFMFRSCFVLLYSFSLLSMESPNDNANINFTNPNGIKFYVQKNPDIVDEYKKKLAKILGNEIKKPTSTPNFNHYLEDFYFVSKPIKSMLFHFSFIVDVEQTALVRLPWYDNDPINYSALMIRGNKQKLAVGFSLFSHSPNEKRIHNFKEGKDKIYLKYENSVDSIKKLLMNNDNEFLDALLDENITVLYTANAYSDLVLEDIKFLHQELGVKIREISINDIVLLLSIQIFSSFLELRR